MVVVVAGGGGGPQHSSSQSLGQRTQWVRVLSPRVESQVVWGNGRAAKIKMGLTGPHCSWLVGIFLLDKGRDKRGGKRIGGHAHSHDSISATVAAGWALVAEQQCLRGTTSSLHVVQGSRQPCLWDSCHALSPLLV